MLLLRFCLQIVCEGEFFNKSDASKSFFRVDSLLKKTERWREFASRRETHLFLSSASQFSTGVIANIRLPGFVGDDEALAVCRDIETTKR